MSPPTLSSNMTVGQLRYTCMCTFSEESYEIFVYNSLGMIEAPHFSPRVTMIKFTEAMTRPSPETETSNFSSNVPRVFKANMYLDASSYIYIYILNMENAL